MMTQVTSDVPLLSNGHSQSRKFLTQLFRFDYCVFLGLIAAAIAINVVTPWWFVNVWSIQNARQWYELRGASAVGLKLSEFAALGLSLGFGRWTLHVRAVSVTFLTLILAAAFVFGCQAIQMPWTFGVFCIVVSVGIVYFLGLSLWTLSWVTKLQINREASSASLVSSMNSQFNSRSLFGAMIAIAIAIPVLRMCLPTNRHEPAHPVLDAGFWMIWLAFGITLLASIQLIAMLGRPSWKAWLILIAMIVVGPYFFQQVGSLITQSGAFRFTPTFESNCLAYATMLGFLVGNAILFALLRLCGYTLHRPEP